MQNWSFASGVRINSNAKCHAARPRLTYTVYISNLSFLSCAVGFFAHIMFGGSNGRIDCTKLQKYCKKKTYYKPVCISFRSPASFRNSTGFIEEIDSTYRTRASINKLSEEMCAK